MKQPTTAKLPSTLGLEPWFIANHSVTMGASSSRQGLTCVHLISSHFTTENIWRLLRSTEDIQSRAMQRIDGMSKKAPALAPWPAVATANPRSSIVAKCSNLDRNRVWPAALSAVHACPTESALALAKVGPEEGILIRQGLDLG
jgi:hypothetical protein